MATIQTISNGESGSSVRTKLNDNFSNINAELTQKLSRLAKVAGFSETLTSGVFVEWIVLKANASTTISIGESSGGDELLGEITMAENETLVVRVDKVYITAPTLYFSISGDVDIYIGRKIGFIS